MGESGLKVKEEEVFILFRGFGQNFFDDALLVLLGIGVRARLFPIQGAVFHQLHLAFFPAEVVEAMVRRNPVEPGAELRIALEAVHPIDELDEDFLGQVFGIILVFYISKAYSGHVFAVLGIKIGDHDALLLLVAEPSNGCLAVMNRDNARGVPMRKSAKKQVKTPEMELLEGRVRKGLRTLRNRETGLAQILRNAKNKVVWCACFLLLAHQLGLANRSVQTWEFALSQNRVFVLNPESQSWQLGQLGLPLSEWRALPKPKGMFQALHLLPGPAGGVYVQDAIEPRLCLFDTAGQLVSCRRLPEPYANRRSTRLEVVPRKDGRFVILDKDGGEGSVWKETRPDDANSQWQKSVSVRMPAGIRHCWEAPWYTALCCEGSTKFQCYDPFLNALPIRPESSWFTSPGIRFKRDTLGEVHGFQAMTGSGANQSICFDLNQGFGSCPK
jgi:hypothetical protein